jgi:hypothetical protein
MVTLLPSCSILHAASLLIFFSLAFLSSRGRVHATRLGPPNRTRIARY